MSASFGTKITLMSGPVGKIIVGCQKECGHTAFSFIYVTGLQEGVLYAHHFNTQILPPLDSYINEQPMHV